MNETDADVCAAAYTGRNFVLPYFGGGGTRRSSMCMHKRMKKGAEGRNMRVPGH